MPILTLRRILGFLVAAWLAVALPAGEVGVFGAGGSRGDDAALQAPATAGYEMISARGSWKADCESQELQLFFDEEGLRLLPSSVSSYWQWGMSLTRFGGAEGLRPAGRSTPRARGDRAEYFRGRVIESFRNAPSGIEHGLWIPEAAGSPTLWFDFSFTGGLAAKIAEDGRKMTFAAASGRPVLAGVDLLARDSEGRDVSVRWEKIEPAEGSETVVRLVVQAADHAFPVRVSDRLITLARASRKRGAEAGPRPETSVLSAPANDTCAGAETIPAAGPFPFSSSVVDLTDATAGGDPPLPSCQADVSRSVWFAFTPQTTASYTFSLCAESTGTTAEDTVLAVYAASGACTGFAEVGNGCSDDACGPTGLQSIVSDLPLTAGSRYYVVAWSYGAAAPPPGGGSVQLRVVQNAPPGPAPPNDQCPGAEPIPGAGPFPVLSSVTSDISGATMVGDPPLPSCQANVSRSIWYSFIPAASGRYVFSLCADAPTGTTVDDTVLAVYAAAAACSGLVQVSGACDDDSCSGETAQSRIAGIDLIAGTLYYAVVWSYGTAPIAAGDSAVQLRVGNLASPSNDGCASAQTLGLDSPVPGTTAAALDDTRLPSGSTCFSGVGQISTTAPGADVAYRFTAPEAGRYSFRLSGYDASKNAALYAASDCPAGTPPAVVTACLAAANRNPTSPEEVSCLPLAAGQSVLLYVDETAPTSGSAFTIEATRCAPESEPNGAPASAGEAACGLEGSIAPAGDADFFALGIAAPDSRLFALADGAAGNSTDFDLRVTTSSDTLEYDDLNNDAPFGSVAPNLSGTRLGAGAAFLRVTHYSPAAQAEPYRLYAAIQPPAASATPEAEPNDTIATATAASNDYFSGSLSAPGDVDHFRFSAAAGESVQIGLDLDPARDATPFNGSLALLDASGSTLLLVNDASSGSSTAPGTGNLGANTPYAPGEAMAYRIPAAGSYIVRIALSTGAPGDYLLSIAHGCRVGPSTDLEVTQTEAPDPVAPGGTMTYSIQVRNLGPGPASVVSLSDDLPAGAAFVSAVPSQGVCLGSAPVRCHLGNVAAGASAGVTLQALAPSVPGSLTNFARVSTAVIDGNSGNDAASEVSSVSPDGDGDGVPDPSDCAPGDPSAWSVPSEATGLALSAGAGPTLLQWSAPNSPGGTLVTYDLLRADSPGGFAAPICVVTGATGTSANDSILPSGVFFYLVRARNGCGANLGVASNGVPRQAGSCF